MRMKKQSKTKREIVAISVGCFVKVKTIAM